MDQIKASLEKAQMKFGKKIWLIEDAAHAIGGTLSAGGLLGTIGDIGCYSFFSNKNLPIGEGGMVVTNNPEIASKIKSLRSQAMTRTTTEHHFHGLTDYDVVDEGYNYRPTELTAALARCQFDKVPRNNMRRAELTETYHQKLTPIEDITIPFPVSQIRGIPAYHIFPVLLPNADYVRLVRDHLHHEGIQTSHHYRPVPDFTYFKNLYGDQSKDLPVTFEFSQRELTLPLHPLLSTDDVECITKNIEEALLNK
jgi:dTDP-4-amino-4,6-dideoxygalactose transaminase